MQDFGNFQSPSAGFFLQEYLKVKMSVTEKVFRSVFKKQMQNTDFLRICSSFQHKRLSQYEDVFLLTRNFCQMFKHIKLSKQNLSFPLLSFLAFISPPIIRTLCLGMC